MAGVQNIIDIVDLFDTVAADVAAAKADGKINLLDLPKFMDVFPALQAAVDGADKIAEEAKDLDADEIKLIVQRLIAALEGVAKSLAGVEAPAEANVAVEKGLDLVHFILKTWLLKK